MTGTAVATQDTWRGQLQKQQPQIERALPPQVSVERFVRATETAINNDPALLECDRKSLFKSVMQCAETGLMPNGRDAALVRFKGQVQFIPMIGGIPRLMRNTGEIASIVAEVVCENDDFDFALGSDPHVHHKPPLNDRGEVIGAYASVKTKDGAEYIEVMGIADIKKIQNVSRAKNGPWQTWFEEMARKTVLRRLAKRCPLSTDTLIDLTSRDDHMYDLSAVKQPPSQTAQLSATLRGEAIEQDSDATATESPVDEPIDVEAEDTAPALPDEPMELLEGAPFQSAQEAMEDIEQHIADCTDDMDELKDRYESWKVLCRESFKRPKEVMEAGHALIAAKKAEIEKAAA